MFLTGLMVLSSLVSATTLSCISIIIVIFSIFFTIIIIVYFIYYKYMNCNRENVSKYDYIYQAKNYSLYNMEKVKQINIKNQTYYFYNDIINLKSFESNLLKIDKKHFKGTNIYYIGYITIKKIDDCENIYCVNPLYLLVNHASGYTEEGNRNKYLIFDCTDENKNC